MSLFKQKWIPVLQRKMRQGSNENLFIEQDEEV
jgi:hypothetical protein